MEPVVFGRLLYDFRRNGRISSLQAGEVLWLGSFEQVVWMYLLNVGICCWRIEAGHGLPGVAHWVLYMSCLPLSPNIAIHLKPNLTRHFACPFDVSFLFLHLLLFLPSSFFLFLSFFFPTCQVRVVVLRQSLLLLPLLRLLPSSDGRIPTRTPQHRWKGHI